MVSCRWDMNIVAHLFVVFVWHKYIPREAPRTTPLVGVQPVCSFCGPNWRPLGRGHTRTHPPVEHRSISEIPLKYISCYDNN